MIRYDLQFFAKDGPGGQKTEAASSKKLKDARNKGQVAKSADLTGSISLLAFFVVLKYYVGSMGEGLMIEFSNIYNRFGELSGAGLELKALGNYFKNIMAEAYVDLLMILLPIFVMGVVLAVILNLIQVKWNPTLEPLKPKLDQFNPISGVKRIFSAKTLFKFLKETIIVAVCIYVTYLKLSKDIGLIFNLYGISLVSAIVNMGNLIMELGINISIIYVIIGLADFLYERHKFSDDMKMSKQELKDEWKDTEGNPDVKNKQRRRMQEASKRRMMQSVPEADVIITNPTHFAVALKYEPNSGKAPIVLAKGEDLLALRIKEVAKENKIEIVENKPLARMIYYNVDIGGEIPPELYQAVAEVLALVWKLKNKI